MKLCIITLYSGENEFDMLKKSLEKQHYTKYEHKIYKYLPNKKALKTAYKIVEENRGDYDLYIRLDADMVLNSPEAIGTIVSFFETHQNIDHAIFPVYDYLSQKRILGLHGYRPNVKWGSLEDDLYVDPNPTQGERRSIAHDIPEKLVLHSPNPSKYQAFYFGYHRTLKAKTIKKGSKMSQSMIQWGIIYGVFNRYNKNRSNVSLFACLGALQALKSNVENLSGDNKDDILRDKFNHLDNKDTCSLRKLVTRVPFYTTILGSVGSLYHKIHEIAWRFR